MSEFKDYQIRQADAALKAADSGNGFLDMFKCYEIMGEIGPHPEYMRAILMDDLHLFSHRSSSMLLLEEGKKAARMGMRRYLRRRDIKRLLKSLKEYVELWNLIWALAASAVTYLLVKLL